MSNLTTRRISSKVRALDVKCCETYDQIVMGKTPTDKFWGLVMETDGKLGEKLARRPITALEIDVACAGYHKAFQKLCLRVKK